MGKKGGSSPDVVGAAKQEGIENRETARDVNYANRPDQYNPFGSQTWNTQKMIDPATGQPVTKWTQSQKLSAPMQGVFNQQMGATGQLSSMQQQALNRAQGDMSQGVNWGQFGDPTALEYSPDQIRQRAEDAAYGRETSRLDPQFQQEAQATEVKLRNQGLRPGDEAYDAAMGNFDRRRTDAYEQARMGAVGTGRQEAGQLWDQQLGAADYANALRDKKVQEYLTKRSFNLDEAAALDPTAPINNMNAAFGGEGEQ